MFGAVLLARDGEAPMLATAAASTRAVLEDTISRGIRDGRFGNDTDGDEKLLVLTAWSLVHGLVSLTNDGLADTPPSAESVARILLDGIATRNGVAREMPVTPRRARR